MPEALRPKRVLVVEDESLIAILIADSLAELGYHVVGPAFKLSEALHLAETATLDAGLLDLQLDAVLSGEVADILSRRRIPFLFITGYQMPPRGFHEGTGFLRKPFTIDDLQRALEGLFAENAKR